MATIRDIAERLGVSLSTVSKGLHGAPDISEELRQLVLDTAVEMNYTTKRMRKESTKKLCIFVEHTQYDLPTSYAYEIVLGFKQAAFRGNWNVDVVTITPEFQLEEKYDTFMLRNGYSGSFFIGFYREDNWIGQLETTGVPTVILDNCAPRNPNVAYVGSDSYEGIDTAVKYLKDLHHTRIGFINASESSMVVDYREQAFRASLKEYQLPLDKKLIVHTPLSGLEVSKDLPVLLSNGATAIVCINDHIAIEVLKECKKNGYRVPEDISIIGYDDLPAASEATPPLTTIRQSWLDLGKCSYYTLDCLIMHVACSVNLLRPQLVVRESTGSAPEGTN